MQVKSALDTVYSKMGNLTAVVQCAGIATATKVLGKKGPHPLDVFAKVLVSYCTTHFQKSSGCRS
jgi:hypothetical protein